MSKNTPLTAHFTLEEFTRSATATQKGIGNTPNAAQLENIKKTAQQMELVRTILGDNPIIISSGFRSAVLNKAVGGSDKSSHLTGLAVDFTCPKFGTVKEVCAAIKASKLQFDQIIYEQGRTNWCHIGFGGEMRREVLSWRSGKGYVIGIVDL